METREDQRVIAIIDCITAFRVRYGYGRKLDDPELHTQLVTLLQDYTPIQGWQPIETAPFGIRVLVFVPIEQHRLVIALQTEMGLWLNEAYTPMSYPPTYWMPLPEPPQIRTTLPPSSLSGNGWRITPQEEK